MLFSYNFLPYKRHFSKFWCFSFSPSRRKKGKLKLGCPTPPKEIALKKYWNYLHSTLIAPKLRLSINWRFSFLFLVPTSSRSLKKTRNVAKKICFRASLPWNRWSSQCTGDSCCSWLSSLAARSKFPRRGGTEEKSTHTTHICGGT